VLIDARPGNSEPAAKALKQHLTHLPLQADSLDEITLAIRYLYPHLSRKMCRHIAYYGYKRELDGKFVPKYDVTMSLHSERSGYTTEELWPFLKNIACPTLVIRGKDSNFLSREDAQKICTFISSAEWKEISGATHMPAQENPKEFNKVISDFLHNDF